MIERTYSTADTLLLGFDQALRTLFGQPEAELDERQRDPAVREAMEQSADE